MKKIAAVLLLICSKSFAAFESTGDYNTMNFAYPNTTVSQIVVLSPTQRSGSTIKFEVQARNGGGRNYSTYPTQDDTANVKIELFNGSGQVIATYATSYTRNLRGPTNWSGAPGDTDQPFQTLSISGAMNQNAAYVKISMIGVDGAYWAGNYGPQWKIPTLTIDSSANIAYNPEFGKYNTTIAQGWSSVGSSFGATCGTTSGSSICVTANPEVQVNEHGGGYSATGGTTSGQEGGYTSTLSVDNQTPSTAPAVPPPPTYNSNITAAQQSRLDGFIARTVNNHIIIDQIGNNNTSTIEQFGRKNFIDLDIQGSNNTTSISQTTLSATSVKYNETSIVGNYNNTTIIQQGTGNQNSFVVNAGSNNTISLNQKDGGNHFLDVKLTGNGHNVNVLQQGSGSHKSTIDLTNAGGASTVNVDQNSNTGMVYSIQQSCANALGCSVNITQQQ